MILATAIATNTEYQQGFLHGTKSAMKSGNRTADYLAGFRSGLAVRSKRIPKTVETPLERDDRGELLNVI